MRNLFKFTQQSWNRLQTQLEERMRRLELVQEQLHQLQERIRDELSCLDDHLSSDDPRSSENEDLLRRTGETLETGDRLRLNLNGEDLDLLDSLLRNIPNQTKLFL